MIKLNESITISKLSRKSKISKYKAKKIMQRWIDNGIFEKYNNKFFKISTNYNQDPKNIQRKLINKAKINLEITRLLNLNLIYDKKYMAFIETHPMYNVIYFPILKQKITLKLSNDIINEKYREILIRNNIKVK